MKLLNSTAVLYILVLLLVIFNSALLINIKTEKSTQKILSGKMALLEDVFFDNIQKVRVKTRMDSLGRNNTLVLRFNSTSCSDCVVDEMVRIREHFMDVNHNNIWLLTNEISKETEIMVASVEFQNFLLQQISADILNLTLPDEKTVYYFVLDSAGYANMIYPIDSKYTETTNKYIERIKSLYF